MSKTDAYGDRMKGYEAVSDLVLPNRLPVIVRLDGNSFSKLTKVNKLKKPFDEKFKGWMDAAATAVLEYCSGAQFGYHQSDEISILLLNDQTRQTDPFLSNRVQKLCSLLASTASLAFSKASGIDAIFDCRVFVVPPQEVNNTFLWRQKDAFKNCVSAYCYWALGEKVGKGTARRMVHGLSTKERQEVLFRELGLNVNDLPVWQKRGSWIIRKFELKSVKDVMDPEKFKILVEKGKIDPDHTFVRGVWTSEGAPRFETKSFVEDFLTNADDVA